MTQTSLDREEIGLAKAENDWARLAEGKKWLGRTACRTYKEGSATVRFWLGSAKAWLGTKRNGSTMISEANWTEFRRWLHSTMDGAKTTWRREGHEAKMGLT